MLGMKPQLVARLSLYPAERSPRKTALPSGYGCPCFSSETRSEHGWDGFLLLGEQSMQLGTEREVGFVFLSGEEAAASLRMSGEFYLWERDFIGVAKVIDADLRSWRP